MHAFCWELEHLVILFLITGKMIQAYIAKVVEATPAGTSVTKDYEFSIFEIFCFWIAIESLHMLEHFPDIVMRVVLASLGGGGMDSYSHSTYSVCSGGAL